MPVFFFPVQIPNFTPNPGLHMSMSPWSPPNGILYIHNIPSRFIPTISVLSGHWWGGVGGAGCAREVRCAKLGEGVDSNVWFCAGVRNAILAQDIYCTKPNPEPNAHSSSRVCKGIGNWAPRSTWEYDFATAMAIWPLTQLLTCKMVSSILVAMIWLKVASTTWVSLPITPSTESTNREKNPLVKAILPVLFLLDVLPPSQKLINFFWPPSLHASISKPDANDCFHMESRRPRVDMSTLVYGTLPLWCTSSSDLLRPK